MTRAQPEEVVFVPGDLEAVTAKLSAMATSGVGWVNLRPIVEPQHQPDPPGPFAIFGGSAHKIPTATWLAGKRLPDGTRKPVTVGLQHSSGPRVVARLRELGHAVPDGWRVTQDHPRRGLVAKVPVDEEPGETVAWLVGAAGLVCAVPVTGRWSGSFHAGSD